MTFNVKLVVGAYGWVNPVYNQFKNHKTEFTTSTETNDCQAFNKTTYVKGLSKTIFWINYCQEF